MISNVQPTVLPLWPNGAPGSEDWSQQEEELILPPNLKVVRNIAQPTLTVYLPDPALANGTAVIIAPGGAFHFLSIDMEGTDVARWLNARGVAAFVLKYRLLRTAATTGAELRAEVNATLSDRAGMDERMRPLGPLILADGQQAMRLVRGQASTWDIAPDRIGLLGFSAGGSLTASVALDHDAASRPDFAAVIYGAGREEVVVPATAPPLFLLCAIDDEMAATRSLQLYSAWKAAGKSVELHIYARGGHGFGMQQLGQPTDTWIERFGDWLASTSSGRASFVR
jgi:acetyl esterase/lipase